MSLHVEAIGTCVLVLSSDFKLHLEKVFYVPSFCKNLIFVSKLAPLGFYFNFTDFDFNLLNKYEIIGCVQLVGGIYSIELKSDATYNSMHVSVGLKRYIVNEESLYVVAPEIRTYLY